MQQLAEQQQVVQMDDLAFDYTIRVISAVAFGGLTGELEGYFFSQQLTADVKAMFYTVCY